MQWKIHREGSNKYPPSQNYHCRRIKIFDRWQGNEYLFASYPNHKLRGTTIIKTGNVPNGALYTLKFPRTIPSWFWSIFTSVHTTKYPLKVKIIKIPSAPGKNPTKNPTYVPNMFALCSSVEISVSDSCRKGSTDEYLVIYYDYI